MSPQKLQFGATWFDSNHSISFWFSSSVRLGGTFTLAPFFLPKHHPPNILRPQERFSCSGGVSRSPSRSSVGRREGANRQPGARAGGRRAGRGRLCGGPGVRGRAGRGRGRGAGGNGRGGLFVGTGAMPGSRARRTCATTRSASPAPGIPGTPGYHLRHRERSRGILVVLGALPVRGCAA